MRKSATGDGRPRKLDALGEAGKQGRGICSVFGNGKDVRYQNSDFRIQTNQRAANMWPAVVVSEI